MLPVRKVGSVIIDTDPGDDIDDTWALVQALNTPLDIKLIVTAVGDTARRSLLVAKLLSVAGTQYSCFGINKGGRQDIAVGIGEATKGKHMPTSQFEWVEEYSPEEFKPGCIFENGVERMIETIHKCWEESVPVTLLCIAPLTNIAKAVEVDPSIIPKVKRLVIMGGDIKRNPQRGLPEYNISADIAASKKVFEQDWEIILAPLDSTMLVQLDNERYAKVKSRETPLISALMENNRLWGKGNMTAKSLKANPWDKEMCMSSVLHDCLAIYLATGEECVTMEPVKVVINEAGRTLIDDNGKLISVAIGFEDLNKFLDNLVEVFIK